MQPLALTKGRLRKTIINAALAAACAAVLVACAALNGAEAAKGGGSFSAGTWRAAAPSPSPVVRDHRGEPQTLPPARICRNPRTCRQGWHSNNDQRQHVRDHRT
jgi:hypothetical protein